MQISSTVDDPRVDPQGIPRAIGERVRDALVLLGEGVSRRCPARCGRERCPVCLSNDRGVCGVHCQFQEPVMQLNLWRECLSVRLNGSGQYHPQSLPLRHGRHGGASCSSNVQNEP